MELTRVEAQEIEDAGEDVHIEGGFPEIMPSEKGSSVPRRVEPAPDRLERIAVSMKLSTKPDEAVPTKFAIASTKSSIRAMARIVHLNLRKLLAVFILRVRLSHTLQVQSSS